MAEDAHVMAIQSALIEKDNKLKQMKEELERLTQEFEANYNSITQKDQQIAELQNQIASAKAEFEAMQLQVQNSNKLLQDSSQRLTNLQAKRDSLKESIANINREVMKYDFQIKKLNETPLPVAVETIKDEELEQLQDQVRDAQDRFNKVKNVLIPQIAMEVKSQLMRAQEEIRVENETLQNEYFSLQQKNNELKEQIANVEKERQEELAYIEAQRKQLEQEVVPTDKYEADIATLKAEIVKLDNQIVELERNIENEQKAEENRRDISQKLKQQLDEKQEQYKHQIQEAQNSLNIQKVQITKLKKEIEQQNATNERLQSELEKLQRGQIEKPDFEAIFAQDKAEIERRFTKAMNKEKKAQEQIAAQQSEVEAQIQKKRQIAQVLNDNINKALTEAKKRAEIARKRRLKTKELKLKLKQLEGEYDALQEEVKLSQQKNAQQAKDEQALKLPVFVPGQKQSRKESPKRSPQKPPKIQIPQKPVQKPIDDSELTRLTQEMDKYNQQLTDAQNEMDALKKEEESIKNEMKRLKEENAKLEEGLKSYDEVFQYHKLLKKEAMQFSAPPQKEVKKPTKRTVRK